RRAAPSVVPRLAGMRDHLVTPDFLAVADIVACHIATKARSLASATGDHHSIHDQRPGRILDEEVAAAIALPRPTARSGVQPYDEIVPGGENDFVAVQRDGTLPLPIGRWKLFARWQWVPVFPVEVPGAGVDRLNHIARITEIHDSVVDDRCDFIE